MQYANHICWSWYTGSYTIMAKPIKKSWMALSNDPVFNKEVYPMGIAVHPLGNWDRNSDAYLLGLFGLIGWLRVGLQRLLLQWKWTTQEHPSSREQGKVGRDSIEGDTFRQLRFISCTRELTELKRNLKDVWLLINFSMLVYKIHPPSSWTLSFFLFSVLFGAVTYF